jgi:hypothetical protein
MSGIVNDEVRERAARAQSADVLSKPFAAEDLLRKLDVLLAQREPAPAPPAPSASTPVAPAMSGTNGHAVPPPAAPVPPPRRVAEPVMRAPEPVAPRAPEPVPSRAVEPVTARVAEPQPVRHAAPAPAGREAAAGPSSSAVLRQFAAIDGVHWAVLADREGFLLDASAEGAVDPEIAGALSACLAESSDGLGRELGRGALQGMILEYEQGMVVLYSVGAAALLAIGLGEPAVLGKVRYYAKKALPELMQAV